MYKMRFKRGYLGVLIVTLCLFGSALMCIILNVEKAEEITTKYDYVTDVTGLFEFSDAPQYTDYNPIENYIGYSNTTTAVDSPSGITFVSSNSVNNYAVLVAPSTTVSGTSGSVNNSTSLPQASFSSAPVIMLNSQDAAIVNDGTVSARLYDFKISPVYDWIRSIWPNFADYEQLTLTITTTGGAPNTKALFCYGGYTAPGTGEFTLNVVGTRSTAVQSLTINPDDYTVTYSGTLGSGSPFNSTYSMYESWIAYGAARQRENYFTTTGGNIGAGESYYNTTMSLSFTSTVTSGAEYGYMIPSGGVSLATNGNGYYSTDWTNGQVNGRVTIILDGGLNTSANPASLGITYAGGQITINKGDNWVLGVNGSTYNAGAYRQIALTIDSISGQVQIRPVSFTNFTDYSIIDTVLAEASIASSEGVSGLTFSPLASTPLRWTIGDTVVLMDTYGAVMVDPSLNIGTYWPNMEWYRLWFQSFALYGDSMTINGRTYAVSDESVTIAEDATYSVIENYAYIEGAAYPVVGGSVTIGNNTYNVENNLITISTTYPVSNGKITINGLSYLVVNNSVMVNGVSYPVIGDTVTVNNIYPVFGGSVSVNGTSYPVTGRTVTYNGTSYPVIDGQVTIPNLIEKTYKLKNFYVSFPNDGHVYLTFIDNGVTVDLGTKVSDTVSFGGVWYFSVGLYEGTITTAPVYDWNVGWNGSVDMFIIMSLGLIAVGVVVVKKARGLSMGIIDWLAVGLSVIALVGFLGGF